MIMTMIINNKVFDTRHIQINLDLWNVSLKQINTISRKFIEIEEEEATASLIIH